MERLTAEGLDSNLTRLIQTYCLVQLHPDAATLPVGVAARLGSLVKWVPGSEASDTLVGGSAVAKDRRLESLVDHAIAERWTATKTGEKIGGKRKTTKKKNPKALANALATIAAADPLDLMKALLACPEAHARVGEAETCMSETATSMEAKLAKLKGAA